MTDVENIGGDYHVPVLYEEVLDGLRIKEDGIYVDCTFGGGGHSRGILQQLGSKGRLIALDQDADAKANLPKDDRVLFIATNFRYIARYLRLYNISSVDGILADLGVSSHQFDEDQRGFSIRFNGPMDMRMDQSGNVTARDIVMQYDAASLQKIFSQYGEVTNAKTLALHIVNGRALTEIRSIEDFKNLIAPVVKGNPNKYLAQVFQALRIEVNDEMGALKDLLTQIPDLLKSGGRAAVITFHSLEDRMVKNFFKNETLEEEAYNPFDNTVRKKHLMLVNKKPITASADELKRNRRSRSAKLRIVEKI